MSALPTAPERKWGPGAEQDRYGSHFGPGEEAARRAQRALFDGSGAEQDRYGSHWGLREDTKGRLKTALLTPGHGAEQERYGAHWGLHEDTTDRIKAAAMTAGHGAEQDRYASHWGLREETTDRVKQALSRKNLGPGAEQDRYSSKFGVRSDKPYDIKDAIASGAGRANPSPAEQDRFGSHFGISPDNPVGPGSIGAVGILRSVILPSFGLHSGLSLIAYAAGRYTDRVDTKDLVWPAAPVVNAWWSSIGRRMFHYGLPFSAAWRDLSYPEKLLLGGVTAWGLRLFYRVSSRSVARGKDDPRYLAAKKENGFWDKAAVSHFLPEAAFQTLITLPFTLCFRLTPAAALTPVPAYAELTHNAAIFIFSSGFALEAIADYQLALYTAQKTTGLCRDGVWSIVRHPNYLGEVCIHAAFPLLLYSCGLMHSLALLGPVANYVYLRYVGGDMPTEASQEERYRTEDATKYRQLQDYKTSKNSIWPAAHEASNPWVWAVAAVGVGFVILERGVREYILR